MAVERVERQLREVTGALDDARIEYAVVGGNAIAAWVASVDAEAVRTTKDVDLLVNRGDLARMRETLDPLGYEQAEVLGVWMFMHSENPSPKSAVHLLFANEVVRPGDVAPAPSASDAVTHLDDFRVLDLRNLVAMKLQAFRKRDQVHIYDLISIGLVDRSWVERYPAELGARLTVLLDNPE